MRRDKKPTNTSAIDTLISSGVNIKGDVEFEGGLRIDGHIQGDIKAKKNSNSNSTLILSDAGSITGNIHAPNIMLNGTVNGNVVTQNNLVLKEKAKISGDVHYATIEMTIGATINGNMQFTEEQTELEVVRNKEKIKKSK